MMIQKASLADLDLIVPLFDAYRVFYQKASDKTAAENFLKQRLEKEESIIYLAFNEQQEAMGFVQLYPLFSSTRMKRLWLLNDLFVVPEGRGKGYGIALIERAKDLCRDTNACGLILETTKDNHIGNALYPKTGFSLDEDHNYYSWDA